MEKLSHLSLGGVICEGSSGKERVRDSKGSQCPPCSIHGCRHYWRVFQVLVNLKRHLDPGIGLVSWFLTHKV